MANPPGCGGLHWIATANRRPLVINRHARDTRDYVNGQFRLQRRSLATGDVLAHVPNPGFELLIDRASGDVVTYGRGTYPSTFLMDGATLAQRWGANASERRAPSNEVVVTVP